jgi:hypothetical protein
MNNRKRSMGSKPTNGRFYARRKTNDTDDGVNIIGSEIQQRTRPMPSQPRHDKPPAAAVKRGLSCATKTPAKNGLAVSQPKDELPVAVRKQKPRSTASSRDLTMDNDSRRCPAGSQEDFPMSTGKTPVKPKKKRRRKLKISRDAVLIAGFYALDTVAKFGIEWLRHL